MISPKGPIVKNLIKLGYNFLVAIEAISQNITRAFLTSLGIVFGVASVIAMIAIGQGAQQEILEQLKLLGTNNIIVEPVMEQEEGSVDEEESQKNIEKTRFSPGLTLSDAQSIASVIPQVQFVSPEIIIESLTIRSGLKRTVKLVGVNRHYFETSDFDLAGGNLFTDYQVKNSVPVCVIGHGIKSRFFPKEEALGKRIKCGKLWLTVVGVLKERKMSTQDIQHLGIRDVNMDIYAPITTVLLRYKNRALVTKDEILRNSRRRGRNVRTEEEKNYHQLDRLIVQIKDSKYSSPVADIISRMLTRRHNEIVDFQVIIPEVLLQQERRTKTIFNIVLSCIASISLIVGGIGIMNIMLASVLERIKEIGIRMAVGATPKDILLQFISEAVIISLTGGIVGIILGILLSYVIETATGILTIVSAFSVIISFVVAITVGLIFGINPARKAAQQDPIVSLRYE